MNTTADTDPIKPAIEWLAANPNHEAARYVRAALDSAARHEALAQAAMEATPGGTMVVVVTEGKRTPIFTSTSRVDEVAVASAYMRHRLPLERAVAQNGLAIAEESLEIVQGNADHWTKMLAAIDKMERELAE